MQASLDSAEKKASLSQAKKALLEKQLRGRLGATPNVETIAPRPSSGAAPLSFSQQRLWFLNQLDSGNVAYNIPTALHLRGELDITVLAEAVNAIIRRHEVLRTTFVLIDGQAVQHIAPELSIDIGIQDLSRLTPAEKEAGVLQRAREDGAYCFDLQQGPLLRINLLDLGAQEYVLLFTLHHIVFDGWSAAILFEEFALLYRQLRENRPPLLPPLPIQYADFAHWQRQWLQGERLEKYLAYWRKQLAGVPALLELPADHPRPPVQSGRGAIHAFRISRTLVERLRELSRAYDATLFVTLVAAFDVLLHRYSGQNDFCLGTAVANRNRPQIEPLIGLFANMLVLRADLSGNPRFSDFLKRMISVSFGAQEHQDLPFEKLVEELNPARDRSYSPYFQVIFVLHNVPAGKWEVPGLQVRYMPVDFGSAKSDLDLHITEDSDGFEAAFEYSTDLFEKNTIERMAQHFETLLHSIVRQPEMRVGDLPLLAETEYRQLSEWCCGDALQNAGGLLHQRFEAAAALHPERTAVICGERQLSYGELNQRAQRWAQRLRALGVGPEIRVGLCAERSLEAIVGILAVLKAGGAYVPLDASAPPERIDALLRDCEAAVLLTQSHLSAHLQPKIATLCLDDNAEGTALDIDLPVQKPFSPQQAAYLIYTSGSTGKPKAVLVSHANAVASTAARFQHYREQPEGFLLLSAFAFDSSIAGIFWTLSRGGRLCIAPEGQQLEPRALAAIIERDSPSHLLCLPSLYALLIEHAGTAQLGNLRCVIVAGESCPPPLIDRHYAQVAHAELYNEYGPTEAAVWSSVHAIRPEDGLSQRSVPIGTAIPGWQLYILDARMQPVPAGVPGEVYIGGAGVARGYWHHPALTAEKFVPNPFDGSGARLYRSGDLALLRADGIIEFLGRIDHQVKIRGFRIEPGEIEARLRQHAQIKETSVVVREDRPGDKRIVAYVTQLTSNDDLNPEFLRAFLKETLPDYMIPAAFVVMAQLPLLYNGKLDRNALPAPQMDAQSAQRYVAPRNPVEAELAALWAEALGLERIGIHDNFFELGGHSLLAVTLMERVRSSELPGDIQALFITPTVAGLAASAAPQENSMVIPPNRIPAQCDVLTPEMLPLISLSQAEVDMITTQVPGGAGNVQDIYPLAPLQEGILFHHLLSDEGDVYLLTSMLAFDTRARLDMFCSALQTIVNRHDILRTAILWKALPEPVQVVWRNAPISVEETTLANGDAAAQLQARFASTGFRLDVRRAPMLRCVCAFDAQNSRWLLLMLHHHLCIDHTTIEVLLEELQMHLLGQHDHLPAPLPFRNFVAQARFGIGREEHESFFRDMLGDVEEPTAPFGMLDVQGDGSRTEEASVLLDASASVRLRAQARAAGVSTASLCHLAWAQVLARLCGREDVVFGTVLFGRMQGGTGVDRALGMFINTLPLRIRVGAENIRQSLRNTHVLLAELLRHEHASLALAQRCSGVAAPTPLFSALLNYRYEQQRDPGASTSAPGWEGIEALMGEERTNYPLMLSVDDLGDGFRLVAQTQMPLEPRRICSYMQTTLLQLLEALETAPNRSMRTIEILPECERNRILYDWNATQVDYPADICIHQLFEAQAELTPDAVALVYENQILSYAELNRKANQLAHYLRGRGVGPDTLVGLCVERSLDMVIGLLGVLKAGGAYLPLDPDYPQERLGFMLVDAKPALLLTQVELAERIPGHVQHICLDSDWAAVATQSALNPANRTAPDNLAYVIYTSGSTGRPKGVGVPHKGLLNRLQWMQTYFQLGATDAVLQKTPYSFDVSVWEFFWPLMKGAKLVIAVPGDHREPNRIRRLVEREAVTTLHFVPSMLHVFLDGMRPEYCPTLKRVICSGEALNIDLQQRFFSCSTAGLYNLYGPTEASIDVTSWVCRREDSGNSVAIGKPIANTQTYILDRDFNPVPVGVSGELYLAGIQLARGYLNRPALSAERFVPNPFSEAPGERLYRTGDLGRYRADGNIEYLGRIDYQVKIRGFRIELGEIEAQLSAHQGVKDVVVLACEEPGGGKRLAAYIVGAEAAPDADTLSRYLQGRLPDYMVPSAFVALAALPLSANGKLDRKALPDPDFGARAARHYVAPHNAMEMQLAAIWAAALELERVGVHDDFFELGGHSLSAYRLMDSIRGSLCSDLPYNSIFQASTIAKLAKRIACNRDSAAEATIIPLNRSSSDTLVYCFHPAGGLVHGYRTLADALSREWAVYGIQSRYFFGKMEKNPSIDSLADEYAQVIRRHSASPYRLLGWSMGGLLAVAVAKRLEEDDPGGSVSFVGIIDTHLRVSEVPKRLNMDSLLEELELFEPVDKTAFLNLSSAEKRELEQILAEYPPENAIARIAEWGQIRGYWLSNTPIVPLIAEYAEAKKAAAMINNFDAPVISAPIHAWWAQNSLGINGQAPVEWASYSHKEAYIRILENTTHTSIIKSLALHRALMHALDSREFAV